jgi:hypothetical protein
LGIYVRWSRLHSRQFGVNHFQLVLISSVMSVALIMFRAMNSSAINMEGFKNLWVLTRAINSTKQLSQQNKVSNIKINFKSSNLEWARRWHGCSLRLNLNSFLERNSVMEQFSDPLPSTTIMSIQVHQEKCKLLFITGVRLWIFCKFWAKYCYF